MYDSICFLAVRRQYKPTTRDSGYQLNCFRLKIDTWGISYCVCSIARFSRFLLSGVRTSLDAASVRRQTKSTTTDAGSRLRTVFDELVCSFAYISYFAFGCSSLSRCVQHLLPCRREKKPMTSNDGNQLNWFRRKITHEILRSFFVLCVFNRSIFILLLSMFEPLSIQLP